MEKSTDNRGGWDSKLEFIFSAIGSMVGLGNIWRFPYVCYRSGGGAFLLPFFVALLVCGSPLLFLETSYCQFSSRGPGRVWEICPLFKGIGFGMLTMCGVCSIYYTVIMAWTLYYLAMSCQSELPWSTCGHPWNTERCATANSTGRNSTNVTDNTYYGTPLKDNNITDSTYYGTTSMTVLNSTNDNITTATISVVSPEEEFWFRHVLDLSDSVEDIGHVRWEILICLGIAHFIVFLCLARGVSAMGKIAYVVASLPYIILTCLLVQGCLLPGAMDGIYFYMVPDWDKVLEFDVWRTAATQVLYSIGMGFGIISTLASYNKFNNNCHRDALILPILDCFTSIYAGLVIFAFLGYMSHITGKDIDQVVDEGPGLVFIAYPAALSTLPLPQFWSFIFFLMLFCVGLDSQFLHIQGVTTGLSDAFPNLFMKGKVKLTGALCVISFILGIPFTTQAGFYLLNLFDWYLTSFCLMLIVLLEVLVLAYVYGTDRLYNDLHAMLGFRPMGLWAISWRFVTPLFILVLWLVGLINFKTIGSKYVGYPEWSEYLGFAIACVPILPVLLKAAYALYTSSGSLRQRFRRTTQPSVHWKPAHVKIESTVMESLTTMKS